MEEMLVENYPFDQKDKIKKCVSCKHCKSSISVTEDDFWISLSCDKKCPDLLDFRCLQCLMCDHFEECLRNDHVDKIA